MLSIFKFEHLAVNSTGVSEKKKRGKAVNSAGKYFYFRDWNTKFGCHRLQKGY